ncbi:hypothetical protein [Fulvivirga sediminis]|uniref:Lipoprotein n=1 Tax=Fulvivirga sediminis TaxID=2803949 RepID=A0A937F5S1_9BACT|nr:hypothetical protein [Fulvivirga sediminis]MBL3656270.1 hypothetical protein [Fulvivirga sediminis]
MKKKSFLKYLMLMCVGVYTLWIYSCNPKKGDNESADKDSTESLTSQTSVANVSFPHAKDSSCFAPEEWFTGPVPEPDPSAFPTDPSNCDFHIISWQYFLWLTEKVNGKLRFETMFSDKSITPETKDDTNQELDIVEQALSKGMLVDLSGRAVYSNIIINDIYRDWIIDNHLYNADSLANFDPKANFPVGSLSLKTTWKIIQPGDDTTNLYTTRAKIQLLTMVDGQPRIPENPKTDSVDVALIGLHIAVVVEGHPEFIWATFEFDNNAPDFKTHQTMDSPVSDKDWLLYTSKTLAKNTNVNNAQILKFKDESKQILTPVTQVARQYANGGGSDKNQYNIVQLNENIKGQLKGTEHSIWSNYFEVGAIWFNTEIGQLAPDWSPNVDSAMVTGSLRLSNSTIETFTQKVISLNECFSCHNTMTFFAEDGQILAGKNLSTSHILLKRFQGGGQVKRGK